jgi:hypothetical protein
MEDNSAERCKYLVKVGFNGLREAYERMERHPGLVYNLLDPKHTIGKALRSIEWMNEADNERVLNAYIGTQSKPCGIVQKALERAHINDENNDLHYVTLIPGKLELHNAYDELILKFASKEDYYRLIVSLGLTMDPDP